MGFVADYTGRKSQDIVRQASSVLLNIERVGARLRGMMPRLGEGRLADKAKN